MAASRFGKVCSSFMKRPTVFNWLHVLKPSTLHICNHTRHSSSSAEKKSGPKIYTKTGDKGTSGTFTGERRSKDDVIFEALGATDELSSNVGLALSFCQISSLAEKLEKILSILLDAGAAIATPNSSARDAHKKRTLFSDSHVTELERWIDEMDKSLPTLKNFILPGGSPAACSLHLARAVCRRAERRVVPLVREGETEPEVMKYLNRLSDFLFTAARFTHLTEGGSEVLYRPVAPKT